MYGLCERKEKTGHETTERNSTIMQGGPTSCTSRLSIFFLKNEPVSNSEL